MDFLKIPDSYIYKTGERVIPGSVQADALYEHCARYMFAQQYCKNKKVLNISSGSGYGSVILLKTAKEVFNGDISELSIAYGNKKYGEYNNHFLKIDAQAMDFPDNFFDVIVSFETFEHLPKATSFIQESKRVLKKGGILMVSTPNKVITSPNSTKPRNKFHVKEWDLEQFLNLFKKSFSLLELLGQHYETPQKDSGFSQVISFLTRIVTKNTPGFLYKIIKNNILHYPSFNILSLKVPSEHALHHTTKKDFYLDSHGKSYSIMIGVFKKK